jgi:hypothetical protein
MTLFYLGCHRPRWLERTDVPLFISRTVMEKAPGVLRDKLPRARGRWAMDSGGFTQLQKYGRWTLTAGQYAAEVHRARDEIGGLDWAAGQDWMCEPWVIFGRNKHLKPSHPMYFHGTREARGIPAEGPDEDLDSTIEKHQRWTVDNFLELRSLVPGVIPSLQGWNLHHYVRCAEIYEQAGVDLTAEPVVGLGSVCRRQSTREIDLLVSALEARGYRLHGFGVKIDGLGTYGYLLESADSLAWSDGGRRVHPCAHGPNRFGKVSQSEANCIHYAMAWRRKILATIAAPVQLSLPLGAS